MSAKAAYRRRNRRESENPGGIGAINLLAKWRQYLWRRNRRRISVNAGESAMAKAAKISRKWRHQHIGGNRGVAIGICEMARKSAMAAKLWRGGGSAAASAQWRRSAVISAWRKKIMKISGAYQQGIWRRQRRRNQWRNGEMASGAGGNGARVVGENGIWRWQRPYQRHRMPRRQKSRRWHGGAALSIA